MLIAPADKKCLKDPGPTLHNPSETSAILPALWKLVLRKVGKLQPSDPQTSPKHSQPLPPFDAPLKQD